MQSKDPIQVKKLPDSVMAHFVKSPNHRVLAVTGALVAISPQGKLGVTPYADRTPIPQSIPLNVDPKTGALTDDYSQAIGRKGIIREFEVTLLMDPETVQALITTLSSTLEQLNALKNQASEQKKKSR